MLNDDSINPRISSIHIPSTSITGLVWGELSGKDYDKVSSYFGYSSINEKQILTSVQASDTGFKYNAVESNFVGEIIKLSLYYVDA